jgi:hypothetical protein
MEQQETIPDGDGLYRSVIAPLAFTRDGFSWAKCLHFGVEPDGSETSSLAWEKYVPNDAEVHGYGCRLAARINDRKRQLGKYKERNRHVYCGAYSFRANDVRVLSAIPELGIERADVIHRPQDGEVAHADLQVIWSPDWPDRAGSKTALLDRLWSVCRGPRSHKCDYDRDIDHAFSLDAAPAG